MHHPLFYTLLHCLHQHIQLEFCHDFSWLILYIFDYPFCFPPKPVAFTLKRDKKTKRMTAVDVMIVPEEEVVTEVGIDQELAGMVMRLPSSHPAPSTSFTAAPSSSQQQPQPQPQPQQQPQPQPSSPQSRNGRIDFKYEGQLFHATFGRDGIDPQSVRAIILRSIRSHPALQSLNLDVEIL